MTEFQFPLPDTLLAPADALNLSEEARNALMRSDGIEPEELSAEVAAWTRRALEAPDTGLSSWMSYHQVLGGEQPPRTLDELIRNNPNVAGKLNYLYRAQQALAESGELVPETGVVGTYLDQTMELKVIPWKEILEAIDHFEDWTNARRGVQSSDLSEDYITGHLLDGMINDELIYRRPGQPAVLISGREYLRLKLRQDGEWGVMLVQTSPNAGTDRLHGKSPRELTDEGKVHLKIAGVPVDQMGVFEWIALTLQTDPSQYSPNTLALLLANRMVFDGKMQVADCGFLMDQVQTYMINELF